MKISKIMQCILVAILAISLTCMIGKNSETEKLIAKKSKEHCTYIFNEDYILENNVIERKESQEIIVDISFLNFLPNLKGINISLLTYDKKTKELKKYHKRITKNEEIYKLLSKLDQFNLKFLLNSQEIKNFEKIINTKNKTITTYNKYYDHTKNTAVTTGCSYSNFVMNIILEENTLTIYVETSEYILVETIGEIEINSDKKPKSQFKIITEDVSNILTELNLQIESDINISDLLEKLKYSIETAACLHESEITNLIDSFIERLSKEDLNYAKAWAENKKFENSPTIKAIYIKINHKLKKKNII